MKLSKTVLVAALLATCASAQADWFGTLSGRSANPANSPQLSVEPSFTTSGDYQNLGARINYNVSESLTVYGDVGMSDVVGDGMSFGAGVFYYLPSLSNPGSFLGEMDVAVQGSYHMAGLDQFGVDIDYSALSAALLVSPKMVVNPDNGLNWYANVGFTRLAFDIPGEVVDLGFTRISTGADSSSEIELQLGGGIYLPVGPGTVYAGADLIDEFIIGVGYRFGIQ